MDLLSTPEEPTSVIQIMGDFDSFLTGGRARRRTDRSRYGELSGMESFSSKSSQKSLFGCTNDKSKEQQVEILTSKAKIAKLENQMKSTETDRKRVRIEQERDAVEKERKYMKKAEQNQDLQKQINYLLEKEEGTREDLFHLKKKMDSVSEKYIRDVDMYKRETERLISKQDETKEEHRREITLLRKKLNENETFIFKNRAEESEAQLNLMKSKLSKMSNVMKDNEEMMSKMHLVEQRCMNAEDLLSKQDEAVKVAKAMQSQMTKFKELERQNIKLKEENKLLRDSRDNSMLLQEQYDSIKMKFDKALKQLDMLGILEMENEELKKKIKRWEVEDFPGGTKKARSPTELTRMISDLQKSQLLMMEKQSDLQASGSIKESSLQSITEKYHELKDQFLEIQERERQQTEKSSKLQRRLLLVATERDGIRRILSNYDTEISSDYSLQLLNRVQEAEERACACNKIIDKMENEMEERQSEISLYRLKSTKLEARIEELLSQPTSNQAKDGELKSMNEDLEKTNRDLQEKVDILEARIEQRHLQGDFDPTKTKVVHFAGNPLALSRKLRTLELENLREENDDLHRKIRQLESQGVSVENQSTSQVQVNRGVDKETEELKSQLESSVLQNKRLKEAFKDAISAFRESCYQLFGYKHEMIETNKFQILSMYAERPDDKFIFKSTPEGQLQMIETDFSAQCQDAINTYLARGSSIPAFLSSVTLELFSKQTHIIDTTLAKLAVRT